MDVVQIHRADTLRCMAEGRDDDNDVVLVKLSDRVACDQQSLAAMFRRCIRLDDKVDKYRAGFSADYGYFCRRLGAVTPPSCDVRSGL